MGPEKAGGEPIRGVARDGDGGEEPYDKKAAAAVVALAREKGEESQRQLEVRIDVRIFYLLHTISTLAPNSKASRSIVLTKGGLLAPSSEAPISLAGS